LYFYVCMLQRTRIFLQWKGQESLQEGKKVLFGMYNSHCWQAGESSTVLGSITSSCQYEPFCMCPLLAKLTQHKIIQTTSSKSIQSHSINETKITIHFFSLELLLYCSLWTTSAIYNYSFQLIIKNENAASNVLHRCQITRFVKLSNPNDLVCNGKSQVWLETNHKIWIGK